jgi:hypothetical protein
MNVEAFLLCDCATDQRGKLNILGAFDTLFFKELPGVFRACSIAARVRFDRIESGEHKIRLCIIDADGKRIVPPLEGKLNIGIGPDADSVAANFILGMRDLKFERFGLYRIDLAIDGQLQKSLPIRVVEVKQQEPNQPMN